MSIKSLLEKVQQSSNAPDIEEQLVLTHTYGFRKLRYDLMYLDRTSNNQLTDVIQSLSYAHKRLEGDRVVYWRKGGLGVTENIKYNEQLMQLMGDWGYTKIIYGIHDDELSFEVENEIDEAAMSWMNTVELVLESEYFNSLYRFVDRIQHDDLDVIGIEIYKTKVIINYGKCSYCRS